MSEVESLKSLLAPRIGVALSGGGVRASLYSLGALLCLVDSELNHRVSEIASVSGGSITNGFIAQRCDFSRVKSPDFDRHSSELALAITRGLVRKEAVFAGYVLLFLTLGIVAFARPFNLPAWADVLLVLAFGVALLLRGLLLAKILRRNFFARRDYPVLLGDVNSSVAHIFCATDLNSSMPVYLTNSDPHLFSPAWGRASSEKAAAIGVADAVRASAAFPGGIPPKCLKVAEFGLALTPLQQARRSQEVIFRDTKQPNMLYLADGGVWNNLGTDWFDPLTRISLPASLKHRRADQLLIIDATAPTAVKDQLPSLRYPWLAEVCALFRVLVVSYTSSVMARIQEFTRRTAVGGSDAAPVASRMVDPVSDVATERLAWLGYPGSWSARLSFAGFLMRLFKPWTFRKQWVVRRLADMHLWNSRVPTTLFRIPREIAVQLLIHGYVATGNSLSAHYPEYRYRFPGIDRFTRLLDLDAEWNQQCQVWVLGPRSKWHSKLKYLALASIEDLARGLEETSKALNDILEANMNQKEGNENLFRHLQRRSAAPTDLSPPAPPDRHL